MEKIFELNNQLIQNSLSFMSGFESTINLPIIKYSISTTTPYFTFVTLDILSFAIAIFIMFVYSYYTSMGLTTTRRQAVIIKHGIILIFILLICSTFLIMFGFYADPVFASGQSLFFFGGLYVISFSKQLLKIFIVTLWLVWFIYFTKSRLSGIEDVLVLSLLSLPISLSLVSINHFILLFIALECLSLILYVMAAASKEVGGTVAAVQYFIFGSLGSMLLLLGLAVLYENFMGLFISSWTTLLNLGIVDYSSLSSIAASSLIILGLLLKFGAAPFHSWVIEVYGNLPHYLMWFYSILVKFVMAVVLFRFVQAIPVFGLLEIFGAVSLIVGCLGGLRQTEVKRLFAYGSVMHVGFLLISDFFSFNVYLFTYVLSMLAIGWGLTTLRLNGQEITYISDIARGLRHSSSSFVLLFFVAMLAVAGIPPLAGFWGKYFVLLNLFAGLNIASFISWTVTVIAIGSTMFAYFYYFRILVWVCFSSDIVTKIPILEVPSSKYYVSNFQYALLFILSGFGFILADNLDFFIKLGTNA